MTRLGRRLKQGAGAEFHRVGHEESIPLVRNWGHDVIGYGPSATDELSYYVVRAYDSVEQMRAEQDRFYGSGDWKNGPREAILSMIEGDAEIVIEMPAELVDAMRSGLSDLI